jgi:hypothetical protein
LDFHRFSPNCGFAPVPDGIPFDELKEAPENDQYKCVGFGAEKGLILFCRVGGNSPQDQCYGKLLVEEIVETPPSGVDLVKGRD